MLQKVILFARVNEHHRDYLKVRARINFVQSLHKFSFGHQIQHVMKQILPLMKPKMALGESFTQQDESDDPEQFVTAIDCRLFKSFSFR